MACPAPFEQHQAGKALNEIADCCCGCSAYNIHPSSLRWHGLGQHVRCLEVLPVPFNHRLWPTKGKLTIIDQTVPFKIFKLGMLTCRHPGVVQAHLVAKDSSGHGNDLPLINPPTRIDGTIEQVQQSCPEACCSSLLLCIRGQSACEP